MRILPLLFIPRILSFRNSFDIEKGLIRSPFILLGIILWVVIYIIFSKLLVYFRGVEVFGDILSAKLLSMVFLTFFSLLVMSNIITALSTFYLSRDLELILTKPVDVRSIHSAKILETLLASSWMVVLFALPVLIAYGKVYEAGAVYFLALPCLFLSFILIPAGIGVTVTHIIAKALPAKNARDVIMVLGLIFFIGIFLLFRFLQPEKFLRPESFPTVLEYLTYIGTDSAFMPHYWITEALLSLLSGVRGDSWFYALVLLSNALFFILVAFWSGSLLYMNAVNKAMGSKKRGVRVPLEKLLPGTGLKLRTALLLKDLKIFLRDNSQWPQLLLLIALVVIYIYNFRVLPLSGIPEASFIISNFIAFLNLALAGFVLSAIASRFLFPAVSLEGRAFWIIRSSPVTMKDFLYSKFLSGVLPLVILSGILVYVTNSILEITGLMMIISLITIFLITLAIGGLGVGLGAVYPKFEYDNIASIPMGFGGILFMILALFAVTLTVLFEAWPLYLYLNNKMLGWHFDMWDTVQTCVCFMIVIGLNFACFYFPMKMGIKEIEGERWM